MGKTLQSVLWAKSVWPKPRDQFEWEEGFFWGQKAELGRPDLGTPPPHPRPRDPIDFDPAAPISSSAPAGEPLPAEAPRGRASGGCAPPGPHSNASRPRAAACLFQTNRGGDRVAPTSICELSRRRPQSYRVGALGPPAPRVLAEPGRRKAAPPPLDSASQVSVRRPLCGLRLGKLWFAVRGAGRRAMRARPGAPRPLCTASGASRP